MKTFILISEIDNHFSISDTMPNYPNSKLRPGSVEAVNEHLKSRTEVGPSSSVMQRIYLARDTLEKARVKRMEYTTEYNDSKSKAVSSQLGSVESRAERALKSAKANDAELSPSMPEAATAARVSRKGWSPLANVPVNHGKYGQDDSQDGQDSAVDHGDSSDHSEVYCTDETSRTMSEREIEHGSVVPHHIE